MTVDKSERGKPGGRERLFAEHDGARGSRGADPGTRVTAAADDHLRRGLNDVEHFHIVLPFLAMTVILTARFGVAPEI